MKKIRIIVQAIDTKPEGLEDYDFILKREWGYGFDVSGSNDIDFELPFLEDCADGITKRLNRLLKRKILPYMLNGFDDD